MVQYVGHVVAWRVGSSVLRWGKYGNKVSGGERRGGSVPLYSSFNANREEGWAISIYFTHNPFLASSQVSEVERVSTSKVVLDA